ncbi:hypothetical protein ACIBCT_21280 [Streptosporangium sp. NPDC050855]|uniref:hypothetical protein n=1 Tax=Streptosporangium sp. NPDC050855 TaxID=3366194 RepID=UPI0037B555B2
MPDYPDDILADIAAMRRQQGQLFSSGQQRAPIRRASDGLIMSDRTSPTPPASGVHYFSKNNRPTALTADGDEYDLVPIPPLQAQPVDIAANMTSGNIAGAPTMAQYNALRADVLEVRAQLNALINSLRAAGILLT